MIIKSIIRLWPGDRLQQSSNRWNKLNHLAQALNRCCELCARLDAYQTDQTNIDEITTPRAITCNAAIDDIVNKIDHEIDLLTADGLARDLLIKKQKKTVDWDNWSLVANL